MTSKHTKTPLLTIADVGSHLPDAPVTSMRLGSWGGTAIDLHGPVHNYQAMVPGHDHHLICHCPSGRARLIQTRMGQRHEGVFTAGTALIMPAGLESGWGGDTPMSLRLRVPTRLLDDVEDHLGSGRVFELANRFWVQDLFIDRVASLLLKELDRSTHPGDQLVVESLFTALAAHLWRTHDGQCSVHETGRPIAAERAIRLAIDYIHAHLNSPLSLRELAAVANISRFHFTRMFKRTHGIGPVRYVQSARIAEARRLMAETSLPLVEVALAVGFADQSHFTRWFKQITGMTPGRWSRETGLHHRRQPEAADSHDPGIKRPLPRTET